ncbi:MAG: signal peptidase I [Clostridiales bacterium]|nr:signal peptidase I [Clostridiales bacterium]
MAKEKSEFVEWVQAIAIAFVLSLLIKAFIFEVILVDGHSMAPTIDERDRIIVIKLTKYFSKPKKGDIVIFKNPDNMKLNYVKRVIGLEGDKVQITEGQMLVNDVALDEDYISEPAFTDFDSHIVPKDTIFVLGDNRNLSRDSRDPSIGFIPLKNIVGKAKIRIWPLGSFKVFQ